MAVLSLFMDGSSSTRYHWISHCMDYNSYSTNNFVNPAAHTVFATLLFPDRSPEGIHQHTEFILHYNRSCMTETKVVPNTRK